MLTSLSIRGYCLTALGASIAISSPGCASSASRSAASVGAPAATATAPAAPPDAPVAAAVVTPDPRPAAGAAPATDQPPVDPRIARAAALANRVLGDPTPQQLNAARATPAPSWDRDAYLNDPESYLNWADPNRTFAPAQPGTDVASVRLAGAGSYILNPGEQALLRVSADPGMPCTFSALGMGRFPSRMTSITVAADATGIAETTYTATSDATAGVSVQASSPVRAGIVTFSIFIKAHQ